MSARDEIREVLAEYPDPVLWMGGLVAPELLRRALAELDDAQKTIERLVAETRLAALREVRNEAFAMNRNPENDPHFWGYGAGEITRMINAKFHEARRAHEEGRE